MNQLLQAISTLNPPEPEGPDDNWNMGYDLFSPDGRLIHLGKDVTQMTNPGGPGVKPLRGHETKANSLLYGGMEALKNRGKYPGEYETEGPSGPLGPGNHFQY